MPIHRIAIRDSCAAIVHYGGVGKLSDRFGGWDDQSGVYRAGDPERHVALRRLVWIYIASGVATAIVMAIGLALGVDLSAIVIVGSLLILVAYMTWRRRRNRRLTGSPRQWPTT